MASSSFADRDGWIWFNGEMIPWADAKVHMLTHAMHYGSSVFEGQRAYNGKIFKLEEHTERLFASARMLDLKVEFTEQQVNDACYELLEKNNLVDAYFRPVIWRGSKMMGVSAQNAGVNIGIAAWEWPAYFSDEARMKGLRLAISDWRRPAPETR